MNSDIKKIIELLREIHPNYSEKELEEKATNIWEISLFLIQLQIKNNIEKDINGKIIGILPKENSP
ncbi:MAG TPA: hypothetical protein PKZ36_00280 [Candidatus Paceibacterota bacterium]|nr:hypothetical protein [Candidatus Paceibacterota bacterium]HPT17839.1 hypothetical protein [Candidatus Paceibacterota bacterium]